MTEYTLGDLIIIELALVTFIKDLDLSMQAGQQLSQIIGKTEFQINRIQETLSANIPAAINRNDPKPAPTLFPPLS